jgi:hypothetical protein
MKPHVVLAFLPALVLAAFLAGPECVADPLRIPAFTAYSLPEAEGVRISERQGVTRWTNPAVRINWYGNIRKTGEITAALSLRLPAQLESRLELEVAGQSLPARVQGAGPDTPITVPFGTFILHHTGYHRFSLRSLNAPGQPAGNLEALTLDGPGIADAHFNLEERRNAASVHLNYPVPAGTNIAAFYSEVTAVEDPTSTFYMACGWHRGYFGMQVNSPSERRIIFSVWDSGGEAVDRAKVSDENRVKLLGKGDGVYSGDFGNEGTGGHSHSEVSVEDGPDSAVSGHRATDQWNLHHLLGLLFPPRFPRLDAHLLVAGSQGRRMAQAPPRVQREFLGKQRSFRPKSALRQSMDPNRHRNMDRVDHRIVQPRSDG